MVVLLDSFMKATAVLEMEEETAKAAAAAESAGGLLGAERLARSPFDPLLRKLCEEFTDDQDLSNTLGKLFKVFRRHTPHPHLTTPSRAGPRCSVRQPPPAEPTVGG